MKALERMAKSARHLTPLPFRDLLISIARAAQLPAVPPAPERAGAEKEQQ